MKHHSRANVRAASSSGRCLAPRRGARHLQAGSWGSSAAAARARCEIASFSSGAHLGDRARLALGDERPGRSRSRRSRAARPRACRAARRGRAARGRRARSRPARRRSAPGDRRAVGHRGEQLGAGSRRRSRPRRRSGPSARRAPRRARRPRCRSRRPAPTPRRRSPRARGAPSEARWRRTSSPVSSGSSPAIRLRPSTRAARAQARRPCARCPTRARSSSRAHAPREHPGLLAADRLDAARGQLQQPVERRAPKRRALGGRLHLDQLAAPGHDDVHVDLGAAVLGVGQVEQGLCVDDADRDGRDRVAQRHTRQRRRGRRAAGGPCAWRRSRRRSPRSACRRRPG